MEKRIVKPERCFYNNDSYRIYKCFEYDENNKIIGELIIKGDIPSLNFNTKYNVVGDIVEDSRGKSLVVAYTNELFIEGDDEFKRAFLRQILTENQYQSLIRDIQDPFKALKNGDIQELIKVNGIGETVALRLIAKYQNTKDYSEAFVKFGKLGMSANMINKIAQGFSSAATMIKKFDENPYILADEINGIGFKTADEIALKAGIGEISTKRICAFITNELSTTARNIGDTYMDTDLLFENWVEFSSKKDTINEFKQSLKELVESETVVMLNGGKFIAHKKNYNYEKIIANEIYRIANAKCSINFNDIEDRIAETEEEQGFEFGEEQKSAIRKIKDSNVLVITGSSGCGKSTIARGIVNTIGKNITSVSALAGKASQRLSETTGCNGQTIHRLLRYNPTSGFMYNKDTKLNDKLILVDEVSMIDIWLFSKLIQAVESGSKLVLLGDPNQLEAIGAGNILLDLVNSPYVSSCELKEIHRQAKKSGIIEVATKINNKEQVIDKDFTGDMVFGELKDFKLIVNKYKDKDKKLTSKIIVDEFTQFLDNNIDISELQVIVPMKSRGDSSTSKLNVLLQNIYNPHKAGTPVVEIGIKNKYEIRIGDKVICKKNNYNTKNAMGQEVPIFNGSMGIVKEINNDKGIFIVDFYGIDTIIITKAERYSIELAYAITVHSSQGSQWDNVIVGIDSSMYALLNKELIYTAMTRAKKYCTMVAENKALRMATVRSDLHNKRTLLKKFIKSIFKK